MGPIHKIAIVQLYPKPFNIQSNYDKACNFIKNAAAQGATLAVLPEYHLTNWLPHDPKFIGACSDWETYLEGYCTLARAHNINIVPGTIVQTRPGIPLDSAEGHNPEKVLENVSYFINNVGDILCKYVKKNLWGPIERSHLRSSGRDLHSAFDTPLGKVGILICWDLAFPEAWRELIAQGAKLIIIPTFWTLSDCSEAGLKLNPSAETLFLDSILTSRAFENTCAVVFVNAGGPPGRGYCGISQVTVPFIGPLTRLGSCVEAMSVVDVDMQVVEDAEQNYQVRADLAKDDWHYDYRHQTRDSHSKEKL